jgi:hypothetical protein
MKTYQDTNGLGNLPFNVTTHITIKKMSALAHAIEKNYQSQQFPEPVTNAPDHPAFDLYRKMSKAAMYNENL